jgi:hypothetical protein
VKYGDVTWTSPWPDPLTGPLTDGPLTGDDRPIDEAVAAVPFTHEIDFRGDAMSVRTVYLHLMTEYARHNGHADLLRQVLDGVTGR